MPTAPKGRSNPLSFLLLLLASMGGISGAPAPEHPPIPIRFHLEEPRLVTLVIEDRQGRRIRNLINETPFPAGDNTIWWDGLDESGRSGEWHHGIYEVHGNRVEAGPYHVRGISRKPVELHYEFTLYNPGNPPWNTADGKGGWLANHTPPCSILFVPPDRILAGSWLTENEHGIVVLNPEGHKLGGQIWAGGIWTGANCLARDPGPTPIPGHRAYLASVWENELRLQCILDTPGQQPSDSRLGSGRDQSVLHPPFHFSTRESSSVTVREFFWDTHSKPSVRGLAAWNGRLYCSLPSLNEIMVVDAREHKVVHHLPCKDPGGLAFDSKGNLLVLSEGRLLQFSLLPDGKPDPASSHLLIATRLQAPQAIVLDHQGLIYVSDHGKHHQVLVFHPDGSYLRSIGRENTPHDGPYDPQEMHSPRGLAIVEQNGKETLWVAEENFQPKRISVWSLEGNLIKDFQGPTVYGGGGFLDPSDRNRFYHDGMSFQIDWSSGKSQLSGIYHQPSPSACTLPEWKPSPETPLMVSNQLYMVNAFSGAAVTGTPITGIWHMREGIAHLVAAAGSAQGLNLFSKAYVDLENESVLKSKKGSFVWSDENGNGRMDASELQFLDTSSWGGVTLDSTLAFTLPDSSRLEVRRFTSKHVPIYDLSKATKRFSPAFWMKNSGGGQILDLPDGWSVATTGPIQGFRDGKLLWTYPNPWPGLHASHYAPIPTEPGLMVGATRFLGPPVRINGQYLWGMNGNMGNAYLLTSDGLFVATLFKDVRMAQPWPATVKREMRMNDFSLGTESFFNTLNQTEGGGIYIQNNNHIIRVDGLDSLQPLPRFDLEITPELLKQCQDYSMEVAARRVSEKGRDKLFVSCRSTAPRVDGNLDDWKGSEWVRIDTKTEAALMVSGDRLYAAFKTGHPNLLDNQGDSLPLLFKSGGGLDFMLGSQTPGKEERSQPVEGDKRMIVSLVEHKPVAMIYHAASPGSPHPISFSGPGRTVEFDQIEEVSDSLKFASGRVEVEEFHAGNFFGNKTDRYSGFGYEISLPLALLGLESKPGATLRGDVGILIGNGFQTIQRAYWHNKATGLVSDVPSEAMLTPQLWGTWILDAE